MTDAGLSRRTMLTVAGAGVALAACGGTGGASEASSQGPIKGTGIPLPFGLDPHSPPDEKEVSLAVGGFNPRYITVVQIHSDGSWHFGANHAAAVSAGDEDARLAQALRILKKTDLPGPANGRRKFRHFAQNSNATDKETFHQRRNPAGAVDLDDFDQFGFASQHEIFVYFANPRITLTSGNLISFAPRLDPATNADANDSFFVRQIANPPGLRGQLIAIRNYLAFAEWNQDGTLKQIKKMDPATQKKTYALNLHFTLPKNGNLPAIPMIIDPTTGNGMGTEP